uniref:Advillin n=1 Tax=Gopherus evgoodei TaxID=1825980 RepID=A0A8C4YG23_9SAUR
MIWRQSFWLGLVAGVRIQQGGLVCFSFRAGPDKLIPGCSGAGCQEEIPSLPHAAEWEGICRLGSGSTWSDRWGRRRVTSQALCLLQTRRSGSVLAYDIHYWVGKSSSRDEQGCAAIYTTQLDDYLGGSPVQHREVQGHESELFKGYFKQGIIYKKGGVASGMTHVETNVYDVRRLLHVKGRRNVTATEVEMSWDSFNLGDVFLLDLGKVIIQWNGPESNTRERLKVGTSLDLPCPTPPGVPITPSAVGKRSLEHSPPPGSGSEPDCYILDHAGTKIYVWKGKGATKAERQTAMAKALEFINMKGYPCGTNVETVNDGAESAMFKQLFQTWTIRDQTVGLGKAYSTGKIGEEQPPRSWIPRRARLPSPPACRAQLQGDEGHTAARAVWRIENLELAPVESQWHGFFYGGDCYLVLYTYGVNHQSRYILYIWQGRHATPDELAASAYQAVEVDRQLDGEPVQVRVSMGKEPRHFLAIFKGKLVIFEGGTSRKSSNEPEPPVRLFQIHGTDQSNTKAVEVPAFASSLNSNDVFLLRTQTEHYLWYGKVRGGLAPAGQPAGSEPPASVPLLTQETVAEGQEPAAFWEVLGGKVPYATVCCRLQQEVPDHPPRLFECSNKTGRFVVTEVTDFGQDDLSESDVMLLDTWDQVFLWLGTDANATEKEAALATAQEYLRTHPSGRDTDTPILVVKQGFEPPNFTGWFVAWDPHKWSVSINKVEGWWESGAGGSSRETGQGFSRSSAALD